MSSASIDPLDLRAIESRLAAIERTLESMADLLDEVATEVTIPAATRWLGELSDSVPTAGAGD